MSSTKLRENRAKKRNKGTDTACRSLATFLSRLSLQIKRSSIRAQARYLRLSLMKETDKERNKDFSNPRHAQSSVTCSSLYWGLKREQYECDRLTGEGQITREQKSRESKDRKGSNNNDVARTLRVYCL